ncbi:MAG: nucleotidyltransferase domain-containing protein [Candidatus Methanofastidiosia archaeon]|jgi:predicted nucleotidyltransferase
MKSVIQLRKKERKTLLKKAEKYLEKLEESLKPLSAIVFGSVSRGDFNDASDIDILVIAEGLPSHPLQRFDILLAPFIPGIDPKGYTPSEFERLRQKKDPFIQLVLKEGIILKDELNIFN